MSFTRNDQGAEHPRDSGHLARIREALRTERDLFLALDLVLAEARAMTNAEAGTIYLRDGSLLHVFVGHNEVLARRLGTTAATQRLIAQPLPFDRCSLAGYAGSTRTSVNVPDAYHIEPSRPYLFDRQRDAANMYRTRSVLCVPLADTGGTVHGVLQLINARDGAAYVVPFSPSHEGVIVALGEEVGAAIAARASPPSTDAPTTNANSPAIGDDCTADGKDSRGEAVDTVPLAAAGRAPIVRRLGELVMAHGLISRRDLESALAEQKRTRERLGSILVRRGLIDEQRLVDFLSRQYGVPAVSLAQLVPDPDLVALLPADIARKHEVMPVDRSGHALTLAMADPNNFAAVDDVAFVTGLQVTPAVASLSAIRLAIERAYRVSAGDMNGMLPSAAESIEIVDETNEEEHLDLTELRTSADQAPVVRLANTLLVDAIRRGASDIHVEPGDKSFKVRFRIDGVLQDVVTRAKRLEAALVSRIKIMANLDIAERRRAQDGHIKLRCDSREVDLRVSILPAVLGEAVNIRVLDRSATEFALTQLGLDPAELTQLERAIRSPYGMIVITGPTGAGKTTTLYATLRTLMASGIKIITIEDPVEYTLEGVTQVAVNEAVGWTFASALRSFLRHDPDVILVGEMRDLETAQVAVRAALTGHLVCSTLHTNDCPSTIARLIDMGVPNFLVSYAVRGIVAQRLGRRLCDQCREPYVVDEASLVSYGYVPTGCRELTLHRARGCAHCRFTGMRGRVGFFQVMSCSEEIRRLTMENAGRDEIERVARQQGMKTLREAGLEKVLAGLTTVEEVLRVTAD